MLNKILIRLVDHVIFAGSRGRRPGLGLVELSIVEQRYYALLAVEAGHPIV
jgi:hypothetical protein